MTDAPPQQVRREEIKEQIPYGVVSEELWKFILDREKLPDRVKHELRGDRYIYSKQTWERAEKPRINDDGVDWIMSIISPYCDVAFTTTNLSKEEVNRFTKEMMWAIIGKFEQCYKEFGIADSDLLPVTRLIEQVIFLNLSASREGMIIGQIMPRYSREERYEPMERKGGFWSGFPSFFGRKE